LHPATGVPKEVYASFAAWLTREHGAYVQTLDYRGIGGSRPASLRGFVASMQDWGRLDMAAAVDHLIATYPDSPRMVIGHSIGGQLLGLLPRHDQLDAAVLIASSSGYWRKMTTWRMRAFCALLWYVFLPPVVPLLGYGPTRALRQGEDLPRGVVQEWSRWCRHPRYLGGYLARGDANADRHAIDPHHYDDVRLPIRSIGFTDDPIANPRTVADLLALYPNASIEDTFHAPADVGLRSIGHVGFFSRRSRATLWPLVGDWLARTLQHPPPAG
ncbi:MAG: alpha/beta hydrolase, partial [Acidobacteriota bacterium]